MTYTVEFTARAERELSALPADDQRRIAKRIDALSTTPRPAGCKKLAGPDAFYRIRIGDFRVIHSIEDRKLLVLIIRVDCTNGGDQQRGRRPKVGRIIR
jgi:mRNA interferase RelE/StbE